MSSKVQFDKVNWKAIYDVLFVFHGTVYEIKLLKIVWPLFDLQRSSKVKGLNVNWKIIYDLVYVFHI